MSETPKTAFVMTRPIFSCTSDILGYLRIYPGLDYYNSSYPEDKPLVTVGQVGQIRMWMVHDLAGSQVTSLVCYVKVTSL